MVNPKEVKASAKKLEDNNLRFRSFLKNRADDEELDAQFLELHRELFADYDCCKCGNCCKNCEILLNENDVVAASTYLGQTTESFVAKYLTAADPEDELPYKFKSSPCVFLQEDGKCRIQDCKPTVCREYPHTDKPERLFSLYGILGSAEVCPIVFEILERLKTIYRFRNR